MKIEAILLGTDGQRIEHHELMVGDGLKPDDITAARDFLMRRAALKNLKPVPGYTFARGAVRVWAQNA